MGRLEKLKRQIIEEANIRILTENKPKDGDYRKEKNKEKKVRNLVKADEKGNPITFGQQQFKDVRYGYDNSISPVTLSFGQKVRVTGEIELRKRILVVNF